MSYTEGIITVIKSHEIMYNKIHINVHADSCEFTIIPGAMGKFVELSGLIGHEEWSPKPPHVTYGPYDYNHKSCSKLATLLNETAGIITAYMYVNDVCIDTGFRHSEANVYFEEPAPGEHTMASIISGNPLLVANIKMIESLMAKAIEYAYSQTYDGPLMAEALEYDCLQRPPQFGSRRYYRYSDTVRTNDCDDFNRYHNYGAKIEEGKVCIFGRPLDVTQRTIAEHSLYYHLFAREFYYNLLNAPECGKPAKR